MESIKKKVLKEKYINRARIGGIYCIRCHADSKFWLRSAMDIESARNRFNFSVSMNSSPEHSLSASWKVHGASTFSFEVIETLEMKETQQESEFAEDLSILLELWTEKWATHEQEVSDYGK